MSTKVLMVCLGNICRSPLAHGILESKISTLDAIEVDSAGTSGWHSGEKPDLRSIEIAKQHGIDITKQKARKFKVIDFDNFDYIYVMDQSNYINVIGMAPSQIAKNKVKLILNEVYPDKNLEVPDPYYGGEDGFLKVYNMLDEACDKILNKIKNA